MGELPPFAAAVLDVVEQVPAGKVVTYGDVAELVGSGGPRQVGHVMSRYGSMVAWHRVILATGALPPRHQVQAAALLRAEGVRFRAGGDRVDLTSARWSGPPH